MDAVARRRIEMGARAQEFCRAHPDTDPGYTGAAARLEELMARARELIAAQREGLIDVRAAAARKVELRRTIVTVHLTHLGEAGRAASREEHELGSTLRFKPTASTFLAFRTAAGSMAAEAQAHREVLVKHGLAESVLDQLVQLLDEFDVAVVLGNRGRLAHVGATREIQNVSTEIVRTVRLMNGRNRQRFQDDGELLGAWSSAQSVLRPPQGEPAEVSAPGAATPPAGDVRPAA